MKNAFRSLDRILRGDATRLPDLQRGTIDAPVGGLMAVVILLAMVYGACMGLSALITRWNSPDRYMGWEQVGASAVKVPLLIFLTLLITIPSLYVFNALIGSRLFLAGMLKLMLAAIAVLVAVLASFGTIVAFFAACTDSYHFMKLLNIIVFAIAGFLGLAFLLQTLHRLTVAREMAEMQQQARDAANQRAQEIAALESAAETPSDRSAPPVLSVPPPGALERLSDRAPSRNVKVIFQVWIIIFGLVGAQMGWVLRPFVGDPSQPFTFFRNRQSNFFEDTARTMGHLFSSDDTGSAPGSAPRQSWPRTW